MPTLIAPASHETCGRWSDTGPCGRPAVERLHYANEWMDHPGQPGLALCLGHLNEYMADQLLDDEIAHVALRDDAEQAEADRGAA